MCRGSSDRHHLFYVTINQIRKRGIEMNKNWIYAAGIRAIKTVAQTAIAMIGTNVLITDVNWQAVLSASMLAGVLSILMSTAGLPELE